MRDDLSFMYFADIDPNTGNIVNLNLTPTQLKNLKINKPSE